MIFAKTLGILIALKDMERLPCENTRAFSVPFGKKTCAESWSAIVAIENEDVYLWQTVFFPMVRC